MSLDSHFRGLAFQSRKEVDCLFGCIGSSLWHMGSSLHQEGSFAAHLDSPVMALGLRCGTWGLHCITRGLLLRTWTLVVAFGLSSRAVQPLVASWPVGS